MTRVWNGLGAAHTSEISQLWERAVKSRPKDEALARSIVDQACESGFSALVVTADTPVLGRRERDHRSGFTIPSELPLAAIDQAEVGEFRNVQALLDETQFLDLVDR